MPIETKKIYLPKIVDDEGIVILWHKDSRMLEFVGRNDERWGNYGNGCSTEVTLKAFFKELGIIEKDCQKAFGGKDV